jgi:hypothetical protein
MGLLLVEVPASAAPEDCGYGTCPDVPEVVASDGALFPSYYEERPGSIDYASNAVPEGSPPPPYEWRLRTPCQTDDTNIGACAGDQPECAALPDRTVIYYVVSRRALVTDGPDIGAVNGNWAQVGARCVDVTDLNPAPTPEEVFRYFQQLPLPQLSTVVQPPGGTVLVGLPTIFYTDAPVQQVFTVDIRGFAVVITAVAQGFTWHTGDGGAVVTSDGPGAPYPNQTVTYDYTSGSYTTYLTVTWGGTFTVNGSAPLEVAGTTTTDGPAVQLTAVEARAVLTNPYD